MPTYTFININTRDVEEHKMRISEYDDFVANNEHLIRYIGEAPLFSYSGTGDKIKNDNTWTEVMQKIAEQNPQSPLAERYLRKDQKRIKVEQTIDKFFKRKEREKHGKT